MADCTFPNCACVRQCGIALPPPGSEPSCQFPHCGCHVHCGVGSKHRPLTSSSGVTALRVMQANGKPCPYCAHDMDLTKHRKRPSRDHIVPLARGGPNLASNIVMCCARCNYDKASKLLEEWLDELIWSGDARAKPVAQFIALRQEEAA